MGFDRRRIFLLSFFRVSMVVLVSSNLNAWESQKTSMPLTLNANRDTVEFDWEIKDRKGERFHIRLQLASGWEGWTMNDLQKSASYYEKINKLPDVQASTENIMGSWLAGADLTLSYGFANGHDVGLEMGVRYLIGGRFQHELKENPTEMRYGLTISAIRIPLSLFYRFPLFNRWTWNVMAGCGADFIFPTLNYRFESDVYDFTFNNRGALKDWGVGPRAFVALEKYLFKGIVLRAGISYSSLILDCFQGTLKDSEGGKSDVVLTMVRDSMGEFLSTMSNKEPMGEMIRRARLNFGGIQISAGLGIGLW